MLKSIGLLLLSACSIQAFMGHSPLLGRDAPQGAMNKLLHAQDQRALLSGISLATPVRTVQPQYFDQILDHKHSDATDTWKQKYYVDDQYWGGDGFPVFFMIGGEGPISDRYVDGFYYAEWAKAHKGLIVTLEHRFYGESQPTGDLSNESLKLLSSQQAIQDIANFHKFIVSQFGAHNSKWIAFGGSYPGNLSAWVRLKLPDLFVASVSSSAPVTAELNFYQYLETVTDGLHRFGGDKCVNSFASATAEVEKMISKGDYAALDKYFNTCRPIKDSHDVGVLVSSLNDVLMGITQYNDEGSAQDLTWLCKQMDQLTAQGSTSLEVWKSLTSTGSCLEVNYEETVKQYSTKAEPIRAWLWQTCEEFGYYQSTDSPNEHVFARFYGIAESLKFCNDIFDTNKSAEDFQALIDASNDYYGALEVANMDNIFFVNGAVDPWHTLGVNESANPKSPVGTGVWAHCADMSHPNPMFPNQGLDDTRAAIGKWIDGILSEGVGINTLEALEVYE